MPVEPEAPYRAPTEVAREMAVFAAAFAAMFAIGGRGGIVRLLESPAAYWSRIDWPGALVVGLAALSVIAVIRFLATK